MRRKDTGRNLRMRVQKGCFKVVEVIAIKLPFLIEWYTQNFSNFRVLKISVI